VERNIKDLEHDLDEVKRDLKLTKEDLEGRILAVERQANNDKKDLWRAMSEFGQGLSALKKETSNLKSLTDANFMSLMHVLTVIANKLDIPPKDLKSGDRRSATRKSRG